MFTRLSRRELFAATLFFAGCDAARADSDPTPASLREAVLKADTSDKKADAYKAYFMKVGRAGLKDLMKDEDTGIALQAAWETHLKPVKRVPEVRGRADDVYDPVELKKFVAFLKDRGKVNVPDWWAAGVTDVDQFPGRHHAFVGRADRPFGSEQEKLHKKDAGGRAPTVEEKEGNIVYAAAGRTVTFPKDVFDGLFSRPVGVIGEKQSAVLAFAPKLYAPGRSPLEFQAVGFAGCGGKPTWRADVWASGYSWLPVRDYELLDMTEKDGVVCAFGMAGFSAWAEGFDLATGAVKFRFITSYWCHWSETWGLK